MKSFVLWLLDNGRPVRLFTTDVHDEPVMREVISDMRAQRPELGRWQILAQPASSLDELMQKMACVETVVASRFHNVLCALKLAKPTLSVGYAAKFEMLMTEMGLAEFCQPARSLDLDRLTEQFTELESRSAQLERTMTERTAENARLLKHQFTMLSCLLFGTAEPAGTAAQHERARADILQKGVVMVDGAREGSAGGATSATRFTREISGARKSKVQPSPLSPRIAGAYHKQARARQKLHPSRCRVRARGFATSYPAGPDKLPK